MVWQLFVNHKNLKNIRLDVNQIEDIDLKNVNTIIHLASIANDPMANLTKTLVGKLLH